MLEHQGQLLSHQEEEPEKPWRQTKLHLGIREWEIKNKERKSLRYMISEEFTHMVSA